MSWPSDGGPRFVWAADGPAPLPPPSNGSGFCIGFVYDRANCHHIVQAFESSHLRYAAERARIRCDELNADA